MRTPIAIAAAGVGAAASMYAFVLRPLQQRWGVDAAVSARELPGDDLVAEPTAEDTRVIDIHAPADRVYPWLVQMGYGRAGWYSYDVMDTDRPSATRIVPDLQAIAVGEVMPTHPGGGFTISSIEPDRSLVLYLDTEQLEHEAAAADQSLSSRHMPPGLTLSSGIMRTQPDQFAASWAFIVEPVDEWRCRLIERVRARYDRQDWLSRVTGGLFGMGVFLMMRKQMLGLKERAEGFTLAADPGHTELTPAPAHEIVAQPAG